MTVYTYQAQLISTVNVLLLYAMGILEKSNSMRAANANLFL